MFSHLLRRQAGQAWRVLTDRTDRVLTDSASPQYPEPFANSGGAQQGLWGIRLHECPMSSFSVASRCARYLPSRPISIEPGGAAARGALTLRRLRRLARSRSPSEAPPNRYGRAKGPRAPLPLSGPPRVHRRWSACRCSPWVAHDDPRPSACLLLGDWPSEPCRTGTLVHLERAVPP